MNFLLANGRHAFDPKMTSDIVHRAEVSDLIVCVSSGVVVGLRDGGTRACERKARSDRKPCTIQTTLVVSVLF